MSEPAVEVKHLTRAFGDFKAVDDISFDVAPGEIFGFLGSNGAGKTTAIRMLIGVLPPTSGDARILGIPLGKNRMRVRTMIGYMSQKFSLYDDLTIRENLRFFAGMYSIRKSGRRINETLENTGLSDRADHITESLPFGVKQRLALGSAMLHEPKILFLDEPTAGVDPHGRRVFWEMINALAEEGVTIFVTTHYMDEAEYCNRIALMHRGRIAALGTPDALKNDHMEGRMLEIECDNPPEAMKHLRSGGFDNASLFGTAIHVQVPEDGNKQEDVENILAENGITVHSIETVRPSLEDVFLSVLQRTEGEQ